jgi:SMI1 / KNR4 family (SUKH-1)
MKHADYPAYVARRKLEIKSGKAISRWSAMTEPARVKQINAVEKFIGHKLPTSYRKFLKERGRSELNLLKKRQRKTLQFAGANDLVAWHETVQAWIVRSNGEASEIAAAWRRAHRIDYSQLCSVATTWDNSSALVMNLGPGQAFGRCFLWHHDEPSDLVPMGKDFDEALELVMRGFEKGDKRLKAFLL